VPRGLALYGDDAPEDGGVDPHDAVVLHGSVDGEPADVLFDVVAKDVKVDLDVKAVGLEDFGYVGLLVDYSGRLLGQLNLYLHWLRQLID
jgi:hypothetical protein